MANTRKIVLTVTWEETALTIRALDKLARRVPILSKKLEVLKVKVGAAWLDASEAEEDGD